LLGSTSVDQLLTWEDSRSFRITKIQNRSRVLQRQRTIELK